MVTFRIIEGELTRIELEGNRWFRSSYFEKRFTLSAGPPLNVNSLQQRLQLLLEDPRIQRINAELKPGLRAGEGILDVRVEERTPYKLFLEYDNYQSPSVGENRGLVTLEHQNLTGNGDIVRAQYGRSNGLDPLIDFKYSLPFTAYDTTLSYQYRKILSLSSSNLSKIWILIADRTFTPSRCDSRFIARSIVSLLSS